MAVSARPRNTARAQSAYSLKYDAASPLTAHLAASLASFSYIVLGRRFSQTGTFIPSVF
jgi:hypothetical protein